MPSNLVHTARDEHLWNKAKRLAAKQGHAEDWGYIVGIYKKMKGGSLGKSFAAHPYYAAQRLPGQVPPGYLSAHLDPALMVELTRTPPPFSAEALLAHDVRYRPQAVVRDLGLDMMSENVWARRIQEEADTAPNELIFRKNLFAKMHETRFEPALRRALMERCLGYYRTLQKAERLTIETPVLQKGTGLPVGTKRLWRDGRIYVKQGDGTWRPEAHPRGPTLEDLDEEHVQPALKKGRSLPPGTKRLWRDGKVYVKQPDGSWRPMGRPRAPTQEELDEEPHHFDPARTHYLEQHPALKKGTGYPVGTRRVWSDGLTYIKQSDGTWRPETHPHLPGFDDLHAEGAHLIVRNREFEVVAHYGDSVTIRHLQTGQEGTLSLQQLRQLGAKTNQERIDERAKQTAEQASNAGAASDGSDTGVLDVDRQREEANRRDDAGDGGGASEEESREVAPVPEIPVEPEPHVDPPEEPKQSEEEVQAAVENVPTPSVVYPDPEPRVAQVTPQQSPAITRYAEFLPEIEVRIPDHLKKFPNPSSVEKELFSHQVEAAERMLTSWKNRDGVILSDEAGLGKTISALAALQARGGKRHLIVVPTQGKKALQESWKAAASLYGIELQDGKTAGADSEGFFVVAYNDLVEQDLDENGEKKYEAVVNKKGKVTKRQIHRVREFAKGKWDNVIFDECHNIQGEGLFANAALSLQDNAEKVGYLSATPFTNISDMHYLRKMGLFKTHDEFKAWAEHAGARVDGNVIHNPTSHVPMTAIAATLWCHGMLIKRETSMEGVTSKFGQLSKASLSPEEQQTFDTVNAIFEEALQKPQTKYVNAMVAAALRSTWSKKYWEMAKTDEAIRLGKEALANGKQVAFFTTFTEPDHTSVLSLVKMAHEGRHPDVPDEVRKEWAESIMRRLANLPKPKSPIERLREAFGGGDAVAEIHGATNKDGIKEQNAYQAGKKKVVIATVKKGGTGISLHDKHGTAPRVQINLGVPWSAREFLQVAGRSHRLGSQSNTEMHWLVGDDSMEQRNAAVLADRLKSMGSLTQGDPEATASATDLERFEFSNKESGEEEDIEGLMRAAAELEEARQNGELGEEAQTDAQAARYMFKEMAEAIVSGRNIIDENFEKRKIKEAKQKSLEHRRAAEQLKTLGLEVRYDREHHAFMVPGPRGHNQEEFPNHSKAWYEAQDKLKGKSKAGNKANWGGRKRHSWSDDRVFEGDDLLRLAKKFEVDKVRIDMSAVTRADAAQEKERVAKEKGRIGALSADERNLEALTTAKIKGGHQIGASFKPASHYSALVGAGKAAIGDPIVDLYIPYGATDVSDDVHAAGGSMRGGGYWELPKEKLRDLVDRLRGKDVHKFNDLLFEKSSSRLVLSHLEELPAWLGELLWKQEQCVLSKAAGHKYLRRIDTGKPGKHRYRYFYDIGGGAGLGHHDEFTIGSSFKVTDQGKEGHFHIVGVGGDQLLIHHDESGTEQKVSKQAFTQMLHRQHAQAIEAKRQKVQQQMQGVGNAPRMRQAQIKRQSEKFDATFGGATAPPPPPPEAPAKAAKQRKPPTPKPKQAAAAATAPPPQAVAPSPAPQAPTPQPAAPAQKPQPAAQPPQQAAPSSAGKPGSSAGEQNTVLTTALALRPDAKSGDVLVSLSDLRRKLNWKKDQFDRAVMQLARQGKIILHHHDHPQGLEPAARDELVRDPDRPGDAKHTNHYVGMVLNPDALPTPASGSEAAPPTKPNPALTIPAGPPAGADTNAAPAAPSDYDKMMARLAARAAAKPTTPTSPSATKTPRTPSAPPSGAPSVPASMAARTSGPAGPQSPGARPKPRIMADHEIEDFFAKLPETPKVAPKREPASPKSKKKAVDADKEIQRLEQMEATLRANPSARSTLAVVQQQLKKLKSGKTRKSLLLTIPLSLSSDALNARPGLR